MLNIMKPYVEHRFEGSDVYISMDFERKIRIHVGNGRSYMIDFKTQKFVTLLEKLPEELTKVAHLIDDAVTSMKETFKLQCKEYYHKRDALARAQNRIRDEKRAKLMAYYEEELTKK
jgi:hypothetical protein